MERNVTLDFVRGVAILGILLLNISAFGLPKAAYLNPAWSGSASLSDAWTWALLDLLAQVKFLTLFALLFGAGLQLLLPRGKRWIQSRLTLLALLGLLSGCGGGGDTTASDTASNSAATDGADDSGGSYGAWAEAEVAEDSGGTAEDGASDRLENAKMIYTARLEVETTAFDTADADLRTLVEVLGGYFEQAAVHDYGSGYRSGDYKVRIPADQFQPFLDRVGTLCHVTYQEQTRRKQPSRRR